MTVQLKTDEERKAQKAHARIKNARAIALGEVDTWKGKKVNVKRARDIQMLHECALKVRNEVGILKNFIYFTEEVVRHAEGMRASLDLKTIQFEAKQMVEMLDQALDEAANKLNHG